MTTTTGPRSPLTDVLERFRARSEVTLDEIADALGTSAASGADIDALFDALEAAGTHVRSPEPVDLPAELSGVLKSARLLSAELGRRPSIAEIADHAALDIAAVRRALLFARVMSR